MRPLRGVLTLQLSIVVAFVAAQLLQPWIAHSFVARLILPSVVAAVSIAWLLRTAGWRWHVGIGLVNGLALVLWSLVERVRLGYPAYWIGSGIEAMIMGIVEAAITWGFRLLQERFAPESDSRL